MTSPIILAPANAKIAKVKISDAVMTVASTSQIYIRIPHSSH